MILGLAVVNGGGAALYAIPYADGAGEAAVSGGNFPLFPRIRRRRSALNRSREPSRQPSRRPIEKTQQ